MTQRIHDDEETPTTTAARMLLARRDRSAQPEGRFDSAGRWHPDPHEERACCRHARTPSRAYPYSLLVHCRTAKHVAHLFGVDPEGVARAARSLKSGRPDSAPPPPSPAAIRLLRRAALKIIRDELEASR